MEDKNSDIEHGNERIENDEKETFNSQFSTFNSDDDHVVFIPDRDYYSLMQSLSKLEEAQKELHTMRDKMKNGEWKVEN